MGQQFTGMPSQPALVPHHVMLRQRACSVIWQVLVSDSSFERSFLPINDIGMHSTKKFSEATPLQLEVQVKAWRVYILTCTGMQVYGEYLSCAIPAGNPIAICDGLALTCISMGECGQIEVLLLSVWISVSMHISGYEKMDLL